ncbi:MAG: AAA family ATPase [Sulfuricella sp.]|nr:AAA family ATPase [Sulfuricella sp.]
MRHSYRLESVALHEVGVFDDVRLDFPPLPQKDSEEDKAEIHLFTGPNGCGKSTLLYALAEVFDEFGRFGDFDVERQIYRRFRGLNSSIEFSFLGERGCYGANKNANKLIVSGLIQLFKSTGDCFFGTKSDLLRKYKDATLGASKRYMGHTFSFAVFAYSGQRSLRDTPVTAIQQVTNPLFEAALSFDGGNRPQVLQQWIANNRAQSALAKADGENGAAAIYDQALARITSLIRDVCDLELEFRLERSPLAVVARLNGETVHFDSLPDGLKSIISWVGDLALRLEAIPWKEPGDVFAQPVILFLDEVDIHLHPKWQRRILPAIQKLLPNGQVFVSTHSPFVVGSVEDAWVYKLPEGGHTAGTIAAIPSGAGKSYRLILEEVFGIEGEFDVETEGLFEEFYRLREVFLKDPSNPQALLEAAAKLAERGEEAKLIVARELRQIARISGKELGLA